MLPTVVIEELKPPNLDPACTVEQYYIIIVRLSQ